MIALLACAAPHEDEVVVRVPVHSAADVEALAALGDVWTEHPVDTVDLRLRASRLDELPDYEMRIPDLDAAIARSLASAGSGFFDDWHPLDEIDQRLDDLAADSGGDATVLELGTSVEGRPIRALEIRTGRIDDRPGILITATQHAREWVAASSALWVADRLVHQHGLDPDVDRLRDAWRVVVVPVVNPDGYDYTWTTDRLWRKNRRDDGNGVFGVDLNRNWDLAFGGPGSDGSPSSDNYRGPSAFSEPESDAVRAFVEGRFRYGLHLDLHSTGQLVLSPWGFTATPSPDADLLDVGGADAAVAMAAVHGSSFVAGSVHDALYPASGIAIDWSYGVHGMDSWLFELRDHGQYGFLLPADQIVPAAEEVWAGLLTISDVPQARLDLRADGTLTAGQPATFTVARSTDGSTAEVYWSRTGPGTTPLPDGVALELDGGSSLGTATVGRRGKAEVTATLPASFAGQTVAFQAEDGVHRSVVLQVEIQ